MQDLMAININIGDRTYRLRVAPQDEGKLRKTIKTINDKILEFKTEFAGKDMQDYVSMVLVWYASQLQQENAPAQSDAVKESLSKMEGQLNKLLGI